MFLTNGQNDWVMLHTTIVYDLSLLLKIPNAAFQCGMYLPSLYTKKSAGKRPKQQLLYQIRKKTQYKFLHEFLFHLFTKPYINLKS